ALDNHSVSVNLAIWKNSELCVENSPNKAPVAGKAEQKLDHVSKETYKKTLTHRRKTLQDLTNTSICSSLSKSPKTLEENSAAPSTRRRVPISYKEPNLHSKLRRGDQFTDTQFLDSPIYKVKKKRSFKSNSKL
ncbi:SGO1 protein, partial [Atlantisia rogersi]|nr:SGO1 protein [Atlantisia rogersi]